MSATFARLWDAATTITPEEYAAAEQWWRDAKHEVALLSITAGVTYERMAYVVATASPGVPWRACLQNVSIMVGAVLRGQPLPSGPGCGLEIAVGRRHLNKAFAILRGADFAVCRGPKVTAFAANLLGDMDRVTVDRHVVMAATGGERKQVGMAESKRIALMVQTIGATKQRPPALIMTALWMRAARERATAVVA